MTDWAQLGSGMMACTLEPSPLVHPAIRAALQGDTVRLRDALEGKPLPGGMTPAAVAEKMATLGNAPLWRRMALARKVRGWM